MKLPPEQDHHDIAQDYIEGLLAIAKGRKEKLIKNLVYKVNNLPELDFSVSEHSLFKSDVWQLTKNTDSSDQKILFNSNIVGSNNLKKMISYYFIPNFHPFGTVRSFRSTTTYVYGHRWMEKYLLIPNGLEATTEDIQLITSKMLNEALDSARDFGKKKHYSLLYTYLIFWLSLSSQKLIPDQYRLTVKPNLVDTRERKLDLINVVEKTKEGWRSFTESELAELVKYSLFWLEDGLPKIISITKYITEKKIHENKHAPYKIGGKTTGDPVFEAQLGLKVKKKQLIGFNKITNVQPSVKYPGRYNNIEYNWRFNHRMAVDRVRNALFILICLLIGLRKRELSKLRFEDFYCKGNNWFIDITRFKTAADPNYHGEKTSIPIPSFLGEKVREYKQLRKFHNYMQTGALFQSVIPSRELNKLDRMVARIGRLLGPETNVEAVHSHRFRKTIAEIIINRSEKNIDLIRLLFGHTSYKMTLRYIARNPYMVETIIEALKDSYASEFSLIIEAVKSNKYSGDVAKRISKKLEGSKELYKGEVLKIKVYEYISYLVENGDPILIQQTNLGQTCCYSNADTAMKLPCHQYIDTELEGPIISNCQIDCEYLVVTKLAQKGLENNIHFYEKLLSQSGDVMKVEAKDRIHQNLIKNEQHLANLNHKNKSDKLAEAEVNK